MKWVNANLGPKAIIFPGFGLPDRTRAAIQHLSGEYPTKKVYTHLGWRKIDGKWFYLHAGGSIGPNDGTNNQDNGPNNDKTQVEKNQLDRKDNLKNGTVGTLFTEKGDVKDV